MRTVLILMTIGALITNVIGAIEYSQILNAPQATILQQIAGLLEVGTSSLCLLIGVAGLAIVQAIRQLPGATAREPESKARWWQDKNNPGKE